jgi:hypothetical protein
MENKIKKFWTLAIGGVLLTIMLLASGCVVYPAPYQGHSHGEVTIRTWQGYHYDGYRDYGRHNRGHRGHKYWRSRTWR